MPLGRVGVAVHRWLQIGCPWSMEHGAITMVDLFPPCHSHHHAWPRPSTHVVLDFPDTTHTTERSLVFCLGTLFLGGFLGLVHSVALSPFLGLPGPIIPIVVCIIPGVGRWAR
jgi:hypothetical protein